MSTLARAWFRVLGDGDENDRDIRQFIERADFRKPGYRWFPTSADQDAKDERDEKDKAGEGDERVKNWWLGRGDSPETAHGVYTYRGRDSVTNNKPGMRSSETWPNAEWNHLMGEARAVAASWRPRTYYPHPQSTTPSTKPDSEKPSIAEHEHNPNKDTTNPDEALAKRFSPREKHSLYLRLDLGTDPRPNHLTTTPQINPQEGQKKRVLHPKTSRYLTETLNSLLRILDIGKSGPLSASSAYIDGKLVPTSDSSFVTVSGGLEEVRMVRRMVKEFLWWVGAPVGSLLEGEALSLISSSSSSSSGSGNGGNGNGEKGGFDLTCDSEEDDGDDDKITSSSFQEEKEAETSKDRGKKRERYLGFTVPAILPKPSWLVSHTLPSSLLSVLQSPEVLGIDTTTTTTTTTPATTTTTTPTTTTITKPTKQGWITIKTPDGGSLSLNLTRPNSNNSTSKTTTSKKTTPKPSKTSKTSKTTKNSSSSKDENENEEKEEEIKGTGAISLQNITPQTSGILYRFMRATGGVLTPVGIAAHPLDEEIEELCWVPHLVVSDSEGLYSILVGGAFGFWNQD